MTQNSPKQREPERHTVDVHRIETVAQLETLYGAAGESALAKETPTINSAYRRLLEAAPFCSIASIGQQGMDCSPRGDGPGFVRILDDRTIAIADRRGNNRLDTLRNIVVDPRVALLFLIPGWNEALRINGRSHLSADPDLLRPFAVNDKLPATVIITEIDTMYFQCARAIKRARLWDPGARVPLSKLPTAGDLVQSVIADFDGPAYDDALPERQAKTLY